MMNFRIKKISVPIVVKLVSWTSAILILVSALIAWQNSKLFEKISIDREETSSEAIVSAKTLEIEAILDSYMDKMVSMAAHDIQNESLTGDMVYYQLESELAGFVQKSVSNQNEKDLNLESLSNFIKDSQEKLTTIKSGGVHIVSTNSVLKTPYLLIAAPVAREAGLVTHWAWAAFKMNRIQTSFDNKRNTTTYLLDGTGKIISHPNQELTLSSKDMSSEKAISDILKNELRQKQIYANDSLYSVHKTLFGPIVVSETSLASIMAPSKLARDTSIFILGTVLSVAFFISFVFGHTFSKNIEALSDIAHQIGQGNFAIRARDRIKSADEIGHLAEAFDEMTEGLEERDKIKTMFNKFHGTEVTDQLMNAEDLRQGQRQDVVVFFSDIRGFTEFSEGKSPEEVMSMLNEYFEVMVGIIKSYGGIVDKFVGDAIMAVWGAPQSTGDDSYKAVMACIEMRKALHTLNQSRIDRGLTPIRIGMGLHAGPALAGTLGSDERMEYTVIGDTVNTASRIESSTKSFGTDLLISEEVARRLEDRCLLNFAGETEVKGKKNSLKLAKVDGYIGENGETVIVKTPWSSYSAEVDDKVKGIKTA